MEKKKAAGLPAAFQKKCGSVSNGFAVKVQREGHMTPLRANVVPDTADHPKFAVGVAQEQLISLSWR